MATMTGGGRWECRFTCLSMTLPDVIGGRVAKTAWVGMQPAFAAHEEREAGLGLGT